MIDSKGDEYGYYTDNFVDFSTTGFQHSFGLQAMLPLVSHNTLVLGLVYDPAVRLSSDRTSNLRRGRDTLSYSGDTGYFKIPARLGIGAGLVVGSKLVLGLDYTWQDWSKATIFNQGDSLRRYSRLSVGAEYVHNRESYTSYLAKIRFRIGVHYENTYLQLNQKSIADYGVSLGLALPMRRSNTYFHIGFEIGRRGTTSNNLIEDNYKRVFISLSLYDYWFFKRKYD